MDFGYFFYMCFFRINFFIYESGDGGVILLDNNIFCKKVIVFGMIKFKMYDGVISILFNVCYISDLKKEFVFFIIFYVNGCKYIAEDGVMKVVMGVYIIIKYKKVRSL